MIWDGDVTNGIDETEFMINNGEMITLILLIELMAYVGIVKATVALVI